MSEACNIWDNLRSAGCCVPADVIFNVFCTADSELSVSETVNDTAIVLLVAAIANTQADDGSGTPAGLDDNDADDSCKHRPVLTADSINA